MWLDVVSVAKAVRQPMARMAPQRRASSRSVLRLLCAHGLGLHGDTKRLELFDHIVHLADVPLTFLSREARLSRSTLSTLYRLDFPPCHLLSRHCGLLHCIDRLMLDRIAVGSLQTTLVDMSKRPFDPTSKSIVVDAGFIVHVVEFVGHHDVLHRYAHCGFVCFYSCWPLRLIISCA